MRGFVCACCFFFYAPSLPHSLVPPLLLSAHIMCPSGAPKTVLHNLHWGDLLCLRHFPAETVINLHWLSHRAHSTCAPAHLNPTDESTWNTRRAAVWLMMVVWLPPPFLSSNIVFPFQTIVPPSRHTRVISTKGEWKRIHQGLDESSVTQTHTNMV